MNGFIFTVDDNIRFFKEITERKYNSIFEHPYLAMYKRLHEKYGLKIQLNLFYECDGFNLSFFSDKYSEDWKSASDWLKLSFHSRLENVRPYEFSGYDEVYCDARAVNSEIIRFASEKSLARTTTIHYCYLTDDGQKAITDNKIIGLLGLYGEGYIPSVCYSSSTENAVKIREGKTVKVKDIFYSGIDIVLNLYSEDVILSKLDGLYGRELIKVMIHEQYFYEDYPAYQPNFEKKLDACFNSLTNNGYKSLFFEDTI